MEHVYSLCMLAFDNLRSKSKVILPESLLRAKQKSESFVENSSGNKQEQFDELLSVFDTCISDDTYKHDVFYSFLAEILQRILQNSEIGLHNYKTFTKFMTILNKARNLFAKNQPMAFAFHAYTQTCIFAGTNEEILEKSSPFFYELFSNSTVLAEFFNSSIANDFLTKILPTIKSKDIVHWALSFLFALPKPTSYSNIRPDPILSALFSSYKSPNVEPEIKQEILQFISTFITGLSQSFPTTFNAILARTGGFKFFESLFEEDIDWITPWTQLFRTSSDGNLTPPNSIVCEKFKSLCRESKSSQPIIFKIVFDFMKTTSIIIPTNKFFDVRFWFYDFQQPLKEILPFFKLIDEKEPEMANTLFGGLFKVMDANRNEDISYYITIIEILSKRPDPIKIIDPFLYLKAFIIKPSPENLAHLFKTNSWFLTFSINVFAHEQAKEIRPQAFASVLLTSKLYDVSARFLKKKPCKYNLKVLMEYVLNNKATHSFNMLMASFIDDKKIASNFVSSDGLEFMDQCLSCDLITPELYGSLLAALVTTKRFEEIDLYILKLPSDHPLFSLNLVQLEQIVYGMNVSPFRPIRVTTLFHFLKPVDKVDPYNSYLLGKYVVQQYIDDGVEICDIPNIIPIANRYLCSAHVSKLLAYRQRFDQFCQMQYDHFPLFQFFPGFGEMRFERNFKALSFWFKFYIPNKQRVSFFSTDNIILYNEDMKLQVSIGDKIHVITKKTTTWCFVYITVEENFRSSTIRVNIDNFEISHNVSSSSRLFTKACFGGTKENLLFLGSSLRFYSKPSTVNTYIKGPGFIDQVKTDNEFVITPYSNFPKPQNCFAVPYFGCPFHFVSMKQLSDLFNLLDSSQTQEQFSSTLNALITINSIYPIPQFWPKLLNSFKKCKSFILFDLLINALVSVSNQEKCEKVLSSIVFDEEVWKSVDNALIVSVLFSYFKNADWGKVVDFQLFLAKVVLNSPPTSTKTIVSQILDNNMKVPQLINHLKSIIVYNNQATEVKHFVIDSFIEYLTPETVDFVKQVFQSQQFILEIMAISERPLAAKLFHLMVLISNNTPAKFVNPEPELTLSLLTLYNEETVWHDSKHLVKRDINFTPLLFSLIWSSIVFSLSHGSLPQQKLYNDTIEELENNISTIMTVKEVLRFITIMFSFLVNLPKFLNIKYNDESIVYIQKVTKTIMNGGETTYKQQMLTNSVIIRFYCKLLTSSTPSNFKILFQTILLSNDFFESETCEIVIKITLQQIFQYKAQFDKSFIYFLIYFVKINYYRYDAYLLIEDLLKSVEYFSRNISLFHQLLVGIIHYADPSTYPQIAKVLHDSFHILDFIIKKEKSKAVWMYIANKISMDSKFTFEPNEHLPQPKEMENNYIDTMRMFESSSISADKDIKNSRFNFQSELSRLLRPLIQVMNKGREYQTSETREFKKLLDFLESTFCLIEERTRWNQFVLSLHTEATDEQSYNPEYYYLSPRCYPYQAAQLITPSLYSICDSTIIELFRKHTNKLDHQPDLYKQFQHYIKHLGKVSYIANIKIIRAGIKVPSLMCMMQNDILFLTYAQLREKSESKREIEFIQQIDSNFLNSVFIGHWGRTTMFASHILIRISLSSIISIKPHNSSTVAFWSFTHGHFLINASRRKKFQLYIHTLFSVGELSTEKLPPEIASQINYDSQAIKSKWQDREMSTEEMLIYMNGIKSRSFSDLDNYPIFPFTYKVDFNINTFPKSREIALILKRLNPYTYSFYRQDGSKNMIDLCFSFDSESFSELDDSQCSTLGELYGNLKPLESSIISEPPPSLISEDTHSTNITGIVKTGRKRERSLSDIHSITQIQKAHDDNNSLMNSNPLIRRVVSTSNLNECIDTENTEDMLQAFANCIPVSGSLQVYPANLFYTPAFLQNLNNIDIEPVEINKNRPFESLRKNASNLEKHDAKVAKWVRLSFKEEIGERNQAVGIDNSPHLAKFNLNQVCQKLEDKCKATMRFIFNNTNIIKMNRLSRRIHTNGQWCVEVDKPHLTLSIINISTGKIVFSSMNHYLAFACRMELSNNGLFVAVDYEFGLTQVYRILYENQCPKSLKMINDFGWKSSPDSVISGKHWLCATAVDSLAVFWEIFTGEIHRKRQFDTKIRAISMDEEVGVWIATKNELYFLSVNNEIISHEIIKLKVTAIQALQLHHSQAKRYAIVGTKDGSLYSVSPIYETGTFEYKMLPSCHNDRIEQIIIHPSFKNMMTIDHEEEVYMWSCMRLGGEISNTSLYRKCPLCDNMKPQCTCHSCNRAVCKSCICPSMNVCTLCGAYNNLF